MSAYRLLIFPVDKEPDRHSLEAPWNWKLKAAMSQ